MSELDPTVFQRYAEYLGRRASSCVTRWTAAGALAGLALGSVFLTSWADWPIPRPQAFLVPLLGAAAGAVLGFKVGNGRAVGLRLQAQLAQHQLHFERTALAGRVATATVPTAAPTPLAPAPVEPPVSAGPPVSTTPLPPFAPAPPFVAPVEPAA